MNRQRYDLLLAHERRVRSYPCQYQNEIRKLYQRVGVRRHRISLRNQLHPRPELVPSDPFGLVISWPAVYTFLSVKAFFGDFGREDRPFGEGLEPLHEVSVGHFLYDQVPHYTKEETDTSQFLCAILTRARSLALEVAIDTYHKDFVEFLALFKNVQQELANECPGDQPEALNIKLKVYAFAEPQHGDAVGKIVIFLNDGKRPGDLDGYVALDLGNTNSTLAYLPGESDKSADIRILDASAELGELTPSAAPVPSQIYIHGVGKKFSDHPNSAWWQIGNQAAIIGASDGSTVVGLKRLLAGPKAEKDFSLFALRGLPEEHGQRKEQIQLKRRVPGELFVCRMFQHLCEAAFARCIKIAVTYPTTFSSRELEQLLKVVHRGWLRMLPKQQDETEIEGLRSRLANPSEQGRQNEGVCALIDEASAAAFFFLYREIFEKPAQLAEFRWKYPRGLNLLLYDCGGGTTDIALVNARVPPNRLDELILTVRARMGLRDFGGDDITVAVARVLKATMAQVLSESFTKQLQDRDVAPLTASLFPATHVQGATVDPARAAATLRANLPRYAREVDAIIPTRFPAEAPVRDDIDRQNRIHTRALWDLAEKLKQDLSSASPAKLPDPLVLRQNKLIRFLAAERVGGDEVALCNALAGIQIYRWQVDALVRDALLRSAQKCNRLIRQRLEYRTARANVEIRPSAIGSAARDSAVPPSAAPDLATVWDSPGDLGTQPEEGPEEVHRVVLAGNSAKYPLLREVLTEYLEVAFLSPSGDQPDPELFDRLEYDVQNLKHAVAKGAVLALMTQINLPGVQVSFQTDLYNHLPFHVVQKDAATGVPELLYHEHQHFKDMPIRRLKLVDSDEAADTLLEAITDVDQAAGSGPSAAGVETSVPATQSAGRDQYISVQRKWPGDDQITPYLRFKFPGGAKQPIYIRYDQQQSNFVVYEQETKRPGIRIEYHPANVYVPPVERGDL